MPPHRKPLLSSTRPRLPQTHTPSSSVPSTLPSHLSSATTRTLIRHHHTLQKKLSHAIATSDTVLAASLQREIDATGGLPAYQRASIQGQKGERGGDATRVLVGWVRELRAELKNVDGVDGGGEGEGEEEGSGAGKADGGKKKRKRQGNEDIDPAAGVSSTDPAPTPTTNPKPKAPPAPPLALLEVGALRPDNACSRSGLFAVTRIDLHSQHAAIETQDFMERALPESKKGAEGEETEWGGIDDEGSVDGDSDEERFDIVSLSLVVNYVGDAIQRGEMLKRVARFLRHGRGLPAGANGTGATAAAEKATAKAAEKGAPPNHQNRSRKEAAEEQARAQAKDPFLPALFLVLPAPCVENSRYLDRPRLRAILAGLGYTVRREKMSGKLGYWYCVYTRGGEEEEDGEEFGKVEVRKGGGRNNFAIVVR